MGNRIHQRALGMTMVVLVGFGLVAGGGGAPAGAARTRLTGSITVSAAASLTTAFTKIGSAFEKKHRGTTVHFNFGSSATLVMQIQSGAPADVFASADLANMDKLDATGFVTTTPTVFARNSMEIAVKPRNPQHIKGLRDLPKVGTIALCATTVPCGLYASSVLRKARVDVPASDISRGQDAVATIGQVENGDAAAAVVYQSDVTAAGSSVTGVGIPPSQNVTAFYPIAPISGSVNLALAKAFVAYVTSRTGEAVLARYGFLAPNSAG